MFGDMLDMYERQRQGFVFPQDEHDDCVESVRRGGHEVEGFPLNFKLNLRLLREEVVQRLCVCVPHVLAVKNFLFFFFYWCIIGLDATDSRTSGANSVTHHR